LAVHPYSESLMVSGQIANIIEFYIKKCDAPTREAAFDLVGLLPAGFKNVVLEGMQQRGVRGASVPLEGMERQGVRGASELLDYALGQLEGPAREEAERQVTADFELAATLARLTGALDLLLDGGETYEPPPGLASRTVARVLKDRARQRTILDFVPVTMR